MTHRQPLPQRRYAETFTVTHGNQNTPFQVTVGYFPDGTVGEVFITGPKVGSDTEANARDGAVLLSIALQWGVPLEAFRHAMLRNADGTPSSILGTVIDRLSTG